MRKHAAGRNVDSIDTARLGPLRNLHALGNRRAARLPGIDRIVVVEAAELLLADSCAFDRATDVAEEKLLRLQALQRASSTITSFGGPSATIRPSLNSRIRSACVNARSTSWVMK